VFSVRFLVVNAPHSEYLAGATDKLCVEDLAGKELWSAEELGIPVYNTEDGEDFISSHLVCTFSLIFYHHRLRYARTLCVNHGLAL
jgi:hypothetical protein